MALWPRRKKDSSMVRAMEDLKEGKVRESFLRAEPERYYPVA